MSFTVKEALIRCIEHREIFADEMRTLIRDMLHGRLTSAQMSALLIGLRVKKETIGEITAAAEVMRELALPVDIVDTNHLVDIVGTGGDNAHSFNISTATMFVTAAAGAKVAKHGNRGVSSNSGSADVLETLGANIFLTPSQIAQCVAQTGIGFMFAPNHHAAMRHVAPIRQELNVRTIFNILGPLTNPAKAPYTLMGVFHPDLVGIQIRVLQRLGAKRALVVYGQDGLDEISLGADTLIGELKNGEISEYVLRPEEFGFQKISLARFKVDNPEQSCAMLLSAIKPDSTDIEHVRDIVCLNSAAALYVAGVAENIHQGLSYARQAIANGAAHTKLKQFVQFTQACSLQD